MAKKVSKLDTYLKMDISKLLQQGDYKTLREMDRYLNTMARQKLSRLEKAGLLQEHRSKLIRGYSNLDFQSTYINKYNATNQDLKKYQNKILKSIGNARHFLNMKSSSVRAYKKWTMVNKKVGIKFKSEQDSKDFYNLWLTLEELCGSILETLGSKEQYHVIMAVQGTLDYGKLTYRERNAYDRIEEYLRSKGEGTKENRLWNAYFNPEYDKKYGNQVILDEDKNVDISEKPMNWKKK